MTANQAESDLRRRYLIEADELHQRIGQGRRTVILDIRFRPDRPDGRPAYRAGHIPGAVYVDLPIELSGEPSGFSGRRPLPSISDLQRDARRWGINDGDAVVVYDDNRGLQAGRAWWVLRWAGIADVRLLNGGLDTWKAAGFPLTETIRLPDPGNIVLSAGHLSDIDADQAASRARVGVLLDARSREHYDGDPATPAERSVGHIPGALSLPATEYLAADGRIASPEVIKDRLKTTTAGDKEIGVYCGGGVAGAFSALVLASIGINTDLFVGSWSAWSSDPSRPVETTSKAA
jgi:thiosulfate/3-mercaptopyruvate sulfurtransferase